MFTRSAAFYDAIYSFKDYADEAAQVTEIIRRRCPKARTLLDVACGTGAHIRYFKERYDCTGVDLDTNLLSIAREANPEVEFCEADMRSFDLGRRFDALTCLFSAIGYAETIEGLQQTARCFARHLNSGGLAIVEPWLTPDRFTDGHIGLTTVDRPDLKIARINTSKRDGIVSVMEFEYLVGTPQGIERMCELHRLALFTQHEYTEAFQAAGFTVDYDPQGPMGRGLYLLRLP